jgi:GNAT superfamily N-acetyltransferase
MPAPNIYFSAISVAPAPGRRARLQMAEALGPHSRDRTTSLLSVCDTWDQLDLRTFGLERRTTGQWLGRPASPGPTAGPGGGDLRIEPITGTDQLAPFERTMVAGFGARPPIAPFDIHGPGILDDPAMHVLGGWCDDDLVACAVAYRTDVVGVYGVTTLPSHRGRGFASAMTVAAIGVAPDCPAVLQPTPQAEGLYRRLGFAPFGSFSHWA